MGQNGPIFSRDKTTSLEVTRRVFMGGVASVSLVAAGVAHASADLQSDANTDLIFDLSDDETHLRIIRVYPDGTKLFDDWLLEVAAFGPEAWFDIDKSELGSKLAIAPKPTKRSFAIRGCSWGRHGARSAGKASSRGLSVVVEFTRKEPTDTSPGNWHVGVRTDAWNIGKASDGLQTKSAPMLFNDFLKSNPMPLATGKLAGVNRALEAMLDGHAKGVGSVSIAFGSDGAWILAGDGKDSEIAAFDGSVMVASGKPGLRLAWESRTNVGDSTSQRVFAARGDAFWQPFSDQPSGDAPGWSMATPNGKPAACKLYIGGLGAGSPALAGSGLPSDSIVAICSAGPARFSASADAQGKKKEGARSAGFCSGLTLSDCFFFRTRIKTAVGHFLRRVIVADAGVKPGAESRTVDPIHIETSIGLLSGRIFETRVDETKAAKATPEESGKEAEKLFDALASASFGDRSGVADRTFFLLSDRDGDKQGKALKPGILRRLSADFLLTATSVALEGTTHSRFTCEDSRFRLIYSDGKALPDMPLPEVSLATPDGYLWLGRAAAGTEHAVLDLGRVTVHGSRSRDMAEAGFRFADLALGFSTGTDGAAERYLRPARQDCRVSVTPEGEMLDSRPILSVLFAPQHVMEEAFFRAEPEPLPDVAWPGGFKDGDVALGSPAAFLNHLDKVDANRRQELRLKLNKAKGGEATEDNPFPNISRALKNNPKLAGTEQAIYIGPYGMTPEAIEEARDWQASNDAARLSGIVDKVLAKANGSNTPPSAADGKPGAFASLAEALAAETEAERKLPLYRLWRDAYRAYVIENVAFDDPVKAEYIREIPGSAFKNLIETDANSSFRIAFIERISGREPFDRLAMARLAGESRLSFRINCEPGEGDSSEIIGLPAHPSDSPAQPGDGVQRFGRIPFTFEALTDWSRHEPYVTQRARKLFEPEANGALPPLAGRTASVDDLNVLESQGFERGAKTAAEHLSQVQASLRTRPDGMETAIELPARLILSTAQDALWHAPGKVDRSLDGPQKPVPEDASNEKGFTPLWTARLLTDDVEPGVRAVWSPDLRPAAVNLVPPQSAGVPRINGAPPRGPWAPWVLRREHVDGVMADHEAVKAVTRGGENLVCEDPAKLGITTVPKYQPSLFDRICEIFWLKALYSNQSNLFMFRSSLDAYDRHELVLLSSAFGLPVTGKRKQVGESDEDAGGLVDSSGQFEPGEEFWISDARAGLAFYRPKPLAVRELALSALGGFLNHDTHFQPPAPALTYDGRPMFDGLSIERWQHEIVLGRDILATVVYAGYMFPLGHKASLVKLTERVFVKVSKDKTASADAVDFGIKAVLRQRMFVRVGQPTKLYPAVGQPNRGRMWCAEDVTMLTRQTPDIMDPNLDLSPGEAGTTGLSGRIHLGDGPGLAFWPQTAMTEQARVWFEFKLDGRKTRLPLIFVDKIAATNPPALKALVEHYKGLEAPSWRTALVGGQRMRFAESVKDGDTSFATDSMEINVEGRASRDEETWPGSNGITDNTPVLEGADQPPFYPVMDAASIRIEQVEQMTGANLLPTRVRYDGHYVKHGFPAAAAEKKRDPKADENTSEAFLYVDRKDPNGDMKNPPKLDMGGNGNQSGGVGRPNMDILALSRSKGVLGADKSQEIYLAKPGKTKVKYDGNEKALLSLANYFSMPRREPQPENPTPEQEKESERYETTFQSHFSDAKLLGVIKFQVLMKLMELIGGSDLIPALQEVVDYGSEVLAKVKEGSAEAVDLLRAEVLAPLLKLVREARTKWSALDGQAVEGQDSLLTKIKEVLPSVQATSLRGLYPEIDRGLNDLEAALLVAMAESEPQALLPRLGVVHEAGRRFMRELSKLAANPVERLEGAARTQFEAAAGDLSKLVDGYLKTALDLTNGFKTYVEDEAEKLAAQLVVWLLDWLIANAPWRELAALVEIKETADLATAAIKTITTVESADLANLVKLLKNGDAGPNSIIDKSVELSIASLQAAADKAVSNIGDPAKDVPKLNVLAAIRLYKKSLDELKVAAEDTTSGLPTDAEWAGWVAEVRRAERLVGLLKRLAKTEGPKDAFDTIVEIARDYFGVDLLAYKTVIDDKLKKTIEGAAAAAMARLLALANPLAGATEIKPELPSEIIPICAAKLPVEPQNADDAAADAPTIAGDAVAAALPVRDPPDPKTPDHFLAPFAQSLPKTSKLKVDLRKALAEIDKVSGIDDKLKTAVKDAANGLLSATTNYQDLFCEVVILVAKAEQVHRLLGDALAELKAAGADDAKLEGAGKKALQTFRSLAHDVEVGLRRSFILAEKIIAEIAKHADVLMGAAALAAVADALKEEVDDVKTRFGDWQAAAVSGTITALNTLFRAAAAVTVFASNQSKGLIDVFAEGVSLLPDLLNPERDALADSARRLGAVISSKADALAGYVLNPGPQTFKELLEVKFPTSGTTTLHDAIKTPGILIGHQEITDALAGVTGAIDALEGRAKGLPEKVKTDFLDNPTALDGPAAQLVKAVDVAYNKESVPKGLLARRNDLIKNTSSNVIAGPAIAKAFLVEPLEPYNPPLSVDNDRLHKEATDIGELAKPEVKPVSDEASRLKLAAFCHSISGGRSSVSLIVENAKDLFDDIRRGDVSKLVDIAALRDEVEERISQLIPVKRTLSYDLGFTFDKESIKKSESVTAGIFVPKPGGKFTLSMVATVDLLKMKADIKSKGHIGAFDIVLVGNIFKAVTIMFDGVDFNYEAGGSPHFDVHYKDFRIEEKLKFIEPLQKWLNKPNTGNGFYRQVQSAPPGMLVGYALGPFSIQLVGIAFSDVSFDANALLRFDGEAALFKFGLGSATAPFTITAGCYVGGGHIAIIADGQGIRGFEASLEFGGGADFSAGPLVAKGRLTTGVYIRTMTVGEGENERRITEIGGTFFVGGTASIWIFHFYASLYVRLTMTPDTGEMTGIAIFTFSFSMGLVDYDFQVTVQRKQPALGGGGSKEGEQPKQQSFLVLDGVDRSIITASPGPSEESDVPDGTNVVEAIVSRFELASLEDFMAQFDLDLLSAGGGK